MTKVFKTQKHMALYPTLSDSHLGIEGTGGVTLAEKLWVSGKKTRPAIERATLLGPALWPQTGPFPSPAYLTVHTHI